MDTPFVLPSAFLPFARHGGDLARAAALFPDAPGPWLDLSTGISARPYPLPVIPRAVWTRLPDQEDVRALETAAARAYGANSPDAIVAAPGSQAIIQRLPALAPGARTVAVLGRTYGEHAAVWRTLGASVRTVLDLEAMAAADVAVVVNPNNPDGRLVAPDDLRRLAGRLAARGGVLVVDEAFADLLDPASSLVPGGVPPAALVLRSFGKVFGLGGMRLGFMVGASALVDAVREALGPWAVSGPSIVVGRAALGDVAWMRHTRERLRKDAAALDAVLSSGGFAPVGGTPLFRLVHHPEAARWFSDLAKAGILVRPFADMPHLRFGLPDGVADLRRLAATLNVRIEEPCLPGREGRQGS